VELIINPLEADSRSTDQETLRVSWEVKIYYKCIQSL